MHYSSPDVPVAITTGDLSDALSASARARGEIAWDIETTGLSWEQDSIEVCQLHVPDVGIEVVVHPRRQATNLCALLSEGCICKTFHHAMFDLRFMWAKWGARAKNVVCTKVMAKLLYPQRATHSLKELLESEIGVEVSKDLATSDWTSQSLTDEQIRYAVNDVAFLPSLRRALEIRLGDASLLGLAQRCCEHIPTRVELDCRKYGDVYTY